MDGREKCGERSGEETYGDGAARGLGGGGGGDEEREEEQEAAAGGRDPPPLNPVERWTRTHGG